MQNSEIELQISEIELQNSEIELEMVYLHDNAPIHTSGLSTAVIQGYTLTVFPYLFYSHDLDPSDFYLFNHLNRAHGGLHFSSKDDFQKAVTDFIDEKSSKFFENAFSQLA